MFRFSHATAVICVFALGCVQSHQDTPISETASLSQEVDTDSDGDDVSHQSIAVSDPTNGIVDQAIDNLDGGWVLSDLWAGYMGVAIQFDGNQYKYWFYSDVVVPDEPEYPLSGTWSWDGPVVKLDSDAHLYDERWHVYRYNGELCLLPDSARQWQLRDGKEHEDRLLFRIENFDARDPFLVRRGSLDDSVHVQTESNGEPSASDAGLVEPVPVTGAVAHNGAPLAGAKVAFHGRYTAVGITDTDGRFALSTFEPDDGAFPGVYVVVIEADGLPRRYADKDTSGLTATIDPDSKQNEFEFMLDD